MLESIGDGVLVLTADGRITLCNRALREILGVEEGAYIGQPALELLRAGPEGAPLLPLESARAVWESIRSGRRPQEDAPDLLELSDGRSLVWSSAPLNSSSAIEGYVVTLRDVTPQVKLERLRDEMVQMLVHDLRTPLTSILMGLDMMRAGMVRSPEDADEMLDTVSQAAHSLMEQVNNLLDMRKLEAGQLELERLPVPVAELVDGTLLPLLPLAQRSQQTVEVDLPTDLPPLEGDRALLRRVLENLLGNAFKFTPARGHVRVSARLLASGQVVELAVQDNGPGVPPELHARIFEKYGQAGSSNARRGTGLGLAFAKLVIEAHHGRIGVRDAPGGGSIFWCRLMIARTVV
ncbi:MAG TPA: ATP-binding protein [Roseiflexaceae bacterium]|nr:ATP-binding protein [Roseiflexaceae bacterium]